MAQKLVTPPASEPITIDQARLQVRRDDTADDTVLTGLIAEARETVEGMARRAFISQTWRLSLDCWPLKEHIALPRPPLQSVTSLIYKDENGTPTTWAASNYIVDTDSEPGRLVLANNASWPSLTLYRANPIQVTYVAGYGATAESVPATWKRAILLLLGHWYENREATISGTIIREIPLGVKNLVWLNRG